MSIFKFWKNWRKKVLYRKLDKLRIQSAQFKEAAEVASYNADEIRRYLDEHTLLAESGYTSSITILNMSQEGLSRSLLIYELNTKISKQHFECTQAQIARLKAKIEALN